VSENLVELRAGSIGALARFVASQLDALFPDEGRDRDCERLAAPLPAALARMRPILAAVRAFEADRFDHLHSLQYSTFLYLLASESARAHGMEGRLADRLFCLNRALNSIDLFHAVELPEVFFLSHGLGAVLGNASYGNRLVVFQNVTVGRVGEHRPQIGAGVVLYPGATVTGKSRIGEGSVVAAGTVVHGVEVPPKRLASMQGGELTFRPLPRDYLSMFLRS